MRAAHKARLGKLSIPTSAAGVLQLAAQVQRLREREGLECVAWPWRRRAASGRSWSAERLGLPYVIVQSFVLARARELDDLRGDKIDQRDAAVIADLACELRSPRSSSSRAAWAKLRSLAQARERDRVERPASLQEQRALFELIWPELLAEAPDLTGSHLQAMLRLGRSPIEIGSKSKASFTARLRREHLRPVPALVGGAAARGGPSGPPRRPVRGGNAPSPARRGAHRGRRARPRAPRRGDGRRARFPSSGKFTRRDLASLLRRLKGQSAVQTAA